MSTHTLVISSGFIAGVPHRNPDLTVVSKNDVLRLEPEPSNIHDPEAIKLIHAPSGQFLGYVPREQTVAIHTALRAGFSVDVVLFTYQPQVKWKEIGYAAFVQAQLPTTPHEHVFEYRGGGDFEYCKICNLQRDRGGF